MGVLSDRRLRWLVVALVVVTVALGGVVALGTVAVLSALASLAAGELALLRFFEATLPYLLAVVGLGFVATGLVAWTVVRAVKLAELPRSERLASAAERTERHVPFVGGFGLSAALSPTLADRREELKERYARGELTEREFEREMAALLDDEGTGFEDDAFDDLDDRLAAARSDTDDDVAFHDPASEESLSTTDRERT